MIPRIIHQTWKTADIPERYRACQASWREYHPDWTYILWTDADIEAFVIEHFPRLLDLFQRYPDQIQRVDAARYMILFKYGGVYADLDVCCRRSFESLLAYDVFLAETEPLGVSNDLMGCAKTSPFFGYLLERLQPAYSHWPRRLVPRHFRVLLTTGSLFVTNGLRAAPFGETIYILPGHLYGAGSDPQTYVTHVPGNTWHRWDSDLFVFLFSNWRTIGLVLMSLLPTILWLR
jgi:hypothetical protein